MTPSDVFRRARESALRIRQIEEEERRLDERIGVQGYSYDRHSKNGILDPARKIIDKIDEGVALDVERGQCLLDIDAAWRLVGGMERYATDIWRRASDARDDGRVDESHDLAVEAENADRSAQVVTLWSVYAADEREMSASMGRTPHDCGMLLRAALAWCDGIGMARLRNG